MFFRFDTLKGKWWVFKEMPRYKSHLKNWKGLRFIKLLGTGSRKGFHAFPDFSTYALLTTWNSWEEWSLFFEESKWLKDLQTYCDHSLVWHLAAIESKGTWGGLNPFHTILKITPDGPIAALTRARIRPSKWLAFQKTVEPSAKSLENHEKGLWFASGIGEIPLLEQATFSVWNSLEDLKAYAYKGKHKKAIAASKRHNFFSEELFARLSIINISGSWPGFNVQQYLTMLPSSPSY